MATEATEAAGHGGEAVGMPQLDFSTWPNQIFWLLVTLVAIYFLLTRIALPRIGAVLADRKGSITNDLAAAEELKQKALKAERAYNGRWRRPVPMRQRSWPKPARAFRKTWMRRLRKPMRRFRRNPPNPKCASTKSGTAPSLP